MTTSTLYTLVGIPCTDACNIPVTSREHEPLLNVTGTRVELDVNQTTPNGVVNPPTPRKPKPDHAADFDARLWPLYPKNGRGSKKKAVEIWGRLSAEDRDAAIASIPAFVAGSDWQRGYSPGANVWLGDRRWENPPAPSAAPHMNGVHKNGRSSYTAQDLARMAMEMESANEPNRDDETVVAAHFRVVR